MTSTTPLNPNSTLPLPEREQAPFPLRRYLCWSRSDRDLRYIGVIYDHERATRELTFLRLNRLLEEREGRWRRNAG